MAIQWRQLWEDLNERQRHFLRVMYRRESDRAAYYNSQKAMFDPKKKGAEWRWMRHNGDGGLARPLNVGAEDEEALRNNQGSGVTYRALEERGFIERRWEAVTLTSLAYGPRVVHLLDVRLTPKGRRLCRTVLEEQQAPDPCDARRDLERKAFGKAAWRGHSLGDWSPVSEGVSVAECRSCGAQVRVEAVARRAGGRITGPAAESGCGGWATHPKNPDRQKAVALGMDRLAALLEEKRGGRTYREAIAEMEASGLGEIGASTLLRAEHGRDVSEDEYRRLCRWVGVTPGELKSEKLRIEELKLGELKPKGLGPEAAAAGNEGV